MLAEQQKRSNIGIAGGLVLEIAGRVLMATGGSTRNAGTGMDRLLLLIPGVILFIAGVGLLIWGCVEYCKGKGQSPWLGLLGFLSCLGLLILVILPDNYKGGVPPSQTGGYGGGPGVWPPPPSR